MDTIYNLLKRAKELKEKSQVDSITPEEVGKLHEDTLAYIASLEQSAEGLGVRKVYQTKNAMEADTAPVGTNGKSLRYGQLVSIYDDAHADSPENGNIYAYQKPGWLLICNVGGIESLKSDVANINRKNAGINSVLIDNGKLIAINTDLIKEYENIVSVSSIKVKFTKSRADWKSIQINHNIVGLSGCRIEFSIGNISSKVLYGDNRRIALIQKDADGAEITRVYGNTTCSDVVKDKTAMLCFMIYYSKGNQLTEDVEVIVSDIQCRVLYDEKLYERLTLIKNYVEVSFHDVIKTHKIVKENNLANINTGIIYTADSLIFVSDQQWASTSFSFSPANEMKGKELRIECGASSNVYEKYIRLRQLSADGNEIKQLMGVSPLNDTIDKRCEKIEIRLIGSWNNAVSGTNETYKFDNIKIWFINEQGQRNSQNSTEVNSTNRGDILSLYPKEKITPVLSGFKYKAGEVNNMYKCFTLLWFSDLHSVDRRLARIRQFYDAYSEYLTDVVSTGDACHTYFQNFTYWASCKAGSFLNIMGNHEMFGTKQQYTLTDEDKAKKIISKYVNAWAVPGYSQKQCYEKFLKPFLNDTGIVCQENKTYWYKDYVDDKIRIIGLDMYHWKEKIPCTVEYAEETGKTKENLFMSTYVNGEPVDTGEQLAWLKTALEDARMKGYHVICLRHSPNINRPLKCTFSNMYYDIQGCPSNEDMQAVDEFVNNGGDFICWLTGHTHADMIGVHSDYPKQIQFAIDTSGALKQPGTIYEFTGNFSRIENTFSDDLFDIVSVDVHHKWITLYRIGCNVDHQGRHVGSLLYDYGNMKMLYND